MPAQPDRLPPDAGDPRPPRIPPHIAWPAFVVCLLVLSLTMAVVTVVAARSDGGAREIEAAPQTDE